MATMKELQGYKVVLIKVMKQEITPEILQEEDPEEIDRTRSGSTCETLINDKDKPSTGKAARTKNRGDFTPKGFIVRRGRVFFSQA